MRIISKELSNEEYIRQINNINPKIEILDIFSKKTGNTGKEKVKKFAKCRCLVDSCDNEWESMLNNLKQGKGCKLCGIKSMAEKRATPRKEFEEFLSNLDNVFKLYNCEYINAYEKLDWIDELGYKYQCSYRNLKKYSKSNKFDARNEYTIENIRLYIKLNNIPYELLSTEYKYSKGKYLLFNCPNHGEFKLSWSNFKSGKGCKKCSDESNQGCINSTIIERNKEDNINKNGLVYIIKCFNETEEFIKIGITATEKENVKNKGYKAIISNRFSHSGKSGGNTNMPYNYEILNHIESNLYNCFYIEQYLHQQYKKYSYQPQMLFSGHNECFSNCIDTNSIEFKQHMEIIKICTLIKTIK